MPAAAPPPPFDPVLTGKVLRFSAWTMFIVTLLTLIFLKVFEPTTGQCAGWRLVRSPGITLWNAVQVTAAWTVWICLLALGWRWVSKWISHHAELTDNSLTNRLVRYLTLGQLSGTTAISLMVFAFSPVVLAIPLIQLLTDCL
ncbi:hypothetical protein V5F49_01765 [Xanthobacter sp. V3C-3]|uniref:hypothetical protein n=1 Tax=Xanthobacter lutulentifluminis TaxID=3119935 RepID=UPI00372B3189